MGDMIYQFAQTYGITLLLIALSGILFLGILKFFKVFDKIEKSKRKYIYAVISALFSIIAIVIYLLIIKSFTWEKMAILGPAIYALNQCAYTLYETIGIRALLRQIGQAIIKIIAENRIQDYIETNQDSDNKKST
jgi:uncharacterized membrane-anchored protein